MQDRAQFGPLKLEPISTLVRGRTLANSNKCTHWTPHATLETCLIRSGIHTLTPTERVRTFIWTATTRQNVLLTAKIVFSFFPKIQRSKKDTLDGWTCLALDWWFDALLQSDERSDTFWSRQYVYSGWRRLTSDTAQGQQVAWISVCRSKI